ncbi:group 3 secretory phospholipase A2 [Embiotoca jacksoni]|uniref:group 3 secretory phospholipase A2 n=1 Tax=Embiotoca jacksoni TaxID=100190 RepID=UPI003704A6D1
MTRIAPLSPLLLPLMLTSSLLAWTPAGASILCTWTEVSPDGVVHSTFLRQTSPSARLYHSARSAQRALLSCAWSDDAAAIQDYLSLCRERTREFSDRPGEHLDLDYVSEDEDKCVSLAAPQVAELNESFGGEGHDARSKVRIHQRVKRGFIVPGTLWCGSGNKAPSFADLGVFSDTDSCCREHDQCKHTILSFHSEFGVFNRNIFTMSHCDCDNKFHSCLKEANDSISNVVGYTFFNLLKMHCFTFSHQLQCMQRNWFGMCKETKLALYADVHPPTLFESTMPEGGDVNITNSTSPADPQLFSIAATTSSVPTPSTGSPTASIGSVPDVRASTGTRTPGSATKRDDDLENTLPTTNRTVNDQDVTELQMSCGIFKDLDKCRNKILPLQEKYGITNPEPSMLYHCNCTARLFQTLAKQRRVSEVQALLLGHVAPSCFLPQDCTAGSTSCTAVVVRAELPQLDHRSSGGADVEEWRHLQAVKLKVRRPNSMRAKRKDRAVRLHRLCLRMSRRQHTDNSRKRNPSAASGARLSVNTTGSQSV